MAVFTLDVAQIIALFFGSLFHGAYLVSFFFGLRCLVWKNMALKPFSDIHWAMLMATATIFVAATLGLTLGMFRSIQAFILCTNPDAAVKVFTSTSDWVNIVKSVTIFVIICTGDGILIYRCWVVYDRRYSVIIFPSLLWIADTVCAIVLTWIEATIQAKSLVNVGKLKPFFTAYTGLTIPLNVITTSLIVLRIWHVDRENAKFRPRSQDKRQSTLQNVMRIMVESGLLYTAIAIVTFCTYVTGSFAFYISTAIQAPLTGIAFNLILIRAHNQPLNEYTLPPTSNSLHFRTNMDSGDTGTTADSATEKLAEQKQKGSEHAISTLETI